MRFDYTRAAVGFLVLIATGVVGAFIGARVSNAAMDQRSHAPEIVKIASNAPLTGSGKYPPDMVPGGQKSFDGSFKTAVGYLSSDHRFSVSLWESGPGILKTSGYPHDEYCLVVTGDLIITNQAGSRQEFHPGDTFVIPKGWAGTWDMRTRFKKQFVALEDQKN
jgi:uncharacterized cupin superfamily protein